MLAVMYDPNTGVIRSLMRGSEETLALNGVHVEVTEERSDYCTHYKVVDGKVVEKSDAELANTFFPPQSLYGLPNLTPGSTGAVVPPPPAPAATVATASSDVAISSTATADAETPATDAPAPDAPTA